jgi:hypothetical protein
MLRSLLIWPYWPKLSNGILGSYVRTLTAQDAKFGFGRLVDIAHAEPTAVAKHGHPVIVRVGVEEFLRLTALGQTRTAAAHEEEAKG